MISSYKPLGNYIQQVNVRNIDLKVSLLKGINMKKQFMTSVANIVGTDMSKYKIVRRGQFAYNPMHVGRDRLLPISLLEDDDEIIVSPAYIVFEVSNLSELLPEYLMKRMNTPEFDRRAWFSTDNSIRGGFSWDSFCRITIPVPPIEEQKVIMLQSLFELQLKLEALKESTIKKLFPV